MGGKEQKDEPSKGRGQGKWTGGVGPWYGTMTVYCLEDSLSAACSASSSPPSVTKLNHRQKRKNASTCHEGEREPGDGEGER